MKYSASSAAAVVVFASANFPSLHVFATSVREEAQGSQIFHTQANFSFLLLLLPVPPGTTLAHERAWPHGGQQGNPCAVCRRRAAHHGLVPRVDKRQGILFPFLHASLLYSCLTLDSHASLFEHGGTMFMALKIDYG